MRERENYGLIYAVLFSLALWVVIGVVVWGIWRHAWR